MSNNDPIDLAVGHPSQSDSSDRSQLAIRQEAEDLKWLMADKRGRRFMWGLLERTGIYRSSFTGNSTTFFNEGQRNVGLATMDLLLKHCPDRYTEMVKEHKQ